MSDNESDNESESDNEGCPGNLIGKHIALEKTIYQSLCSFYEKGKIGQDYNVPVQIFAGSPQAFKRNPMGQTAECYDYVTKHSIRFYIHGPYILNIASPLSVVVKHLLTFELQTGKKTGARGLVIHCGKYTKLSKAVALANMHAAIDEILGYPDACNLILETPAGQGTEMLTTPEEFIEFVKQHKNLKICIDTCHVFAAGHDPLDYLQTIEDAGLEIFLVHLNDSKFPKGAKKDRHTYLGTGHIGIEKMTDCISFCTERGIDMVIE